jgi:hypothetical protein
MSNWKMESTKKEIKSTLILTIFVQEISLIRRLTRNFYFYFYLEFFAFTALRRQLQDRKRLLFDRWTLQLLTPTTDKLLLFITTDISNNVPRTYILFSSLRTTPSTPPPHDRISNISPSFVLMGIRADIVTPGTISSESFLSYLDIMSIFGRSDLSSSPWRLPTLTISIGPSSRPFKRLDYIRIIRINDSSVVATCTYF